jgi:hypothetical protein
VITGFGDVVVVGLALMIGPQVAFPCTTCKEQAKP